MQHVLLPTMPPDTLPQHNVYIQFLWSFLMMFFAMYPRWVYFLKKEHANKISLRELVQRIATRVPVSHRPLLWRPRRIVVGLEPCIQALQKHTDLSKMCKIQPKMQKISCHKKQKTHKEATSKGARFGSQDPKIKIRKAKTRGKAPVKILVDAEKANLWIPT